MTTGGINDGGILAFTEISSSLQSIHTGCMKFKSSMWQSNEFDRKLTECLCHIITLLYITFEGMIYSAHCDVIKWKQFLRYWSFVRGIQRSPVNSPHKGQ